MNFGRVVKLRAAFTRGALTIGKRPKMLDWPHFLFNKGHIHIGDRVSIRSGVVLDAQSGMIKIGNNVSLNDHVVILGHGGICIGNDVRIAAGTIIVSFDHGFDDPDMSIRMQPLRKTPLVIEDDVWIGAGARILAGSYIAKGCVIGAGSVVKGQTVTNGIYVGVPARLLRLRGETPKKN